MALGSNDFYNSEKYKKKMTVAGVYGHGYRNGN